MLTLQLPVNIGSSMSEEVACIVRWRKLRSSEQQADSHASIWHHQASCEEKVPLLLDSQCNGVYSVRDDCYSMEFLRSIYE